jgi:predicted SAM-dependent methyltransferase
MKSYLNLGCGARFHPSWTNIDFVAAGPAVIAHDLRQGIPFADESFDVVYHSHLLEHLPKSQAPSFLRECHRVLKPGGVHRIAVPDLERIARNYLEALDKAAAGDEQWRHNYDWMMLELLDQTVREKSGGDMMGYLQQPLVPNKSFVEMRIGIEARDLMKSAEKNGDAAPPAKPSVMRRLMSRARRSPAYLREAMLRVVTGREYRLLQLARFRRGGEIHLWMYDRYSLARALSSAGFRNPQVVSATQSQIADWPSYNLDTEPDGTIYKPDSLYLEAIK